jgi:hypothetical protein
MPRKARKESGTGIFHVIGTGGTGQCLASLFRSYKIGKLGAVPNLGSFLLDLSEIKEAE